jgi:cubilin
MHQFQTLSKNYNTFLFFSSRSSYDGDRNCEYDIVAPAGRVIVMNVLDFEIEQHSICEFDYLQVFDGASADNSTSLGRFCGNDKPETFTSTYNHLHIHFSSDASIFGRGFVANYSFIDVGCGGIIRDSRELIKPPMDLDGNGVYQSNSECRWLVQAPKGFVININFLNFDLEPDASCKYDYVKIFNNGSGGGQEIGPFCGTNAPKLITTTDNVVTVLFVSDSSTAKDGFTIGFNFIDASKCRIKYKYTYFYSNTFV